MKPETGGTVVGPSVSSPKPFRFRNHFGYSFETISVSKPCLFRIYFETLSVAVSLIIQHAGVRNTLVLSVHMKIGMNFVQYLYRGE